MHWQARSIFLILFLILLLFSLSWFALLCHVRPAPKSQESEKFLKNVNRAQLSEKWSNEPELDIEDEGKFHLVTNIILVTHRAYHTNLLYDNQRPPTVNELEDRQREIETTLQANLNHERIAAIHVLYFHPAVAKYLLELQLKNSKKLILHLTRRDPTVGVNLDYIQKYLKYKYVILSHMDNSIASGWEDIDLIKMRNNRLMYALTRHAISEKYPCNAAVSASCNPGSPYLGSHDTFVFFADKDFGREMLKELDIVPSSSGMENVLIWYFRHELKFKVTNPCLHLIVYHSHCVPLREKGRKRYNRKGKNGLAQFTNELF